MGDDFRSLVAFFCDILVLFCKMIYFTMEDLVCGMLPRKRKSVRGEIVLITGAGHGLGKDMASTFAELGATVVLCGTTKSRIENVANIIESKGGHVFSYQCDVSNEDEVADMARLVRKEVGEVTILVNNAGVMPCKSFSQLTSKEIRRTIDVNLLSHYWTLKEFLPSMITARRGHIVAISSIGGHLGTSNIVDYCASKFGVRGLMLSLREELYADDLEDDIHLTTVFPGTFTSGLIKKPKSKYQLLMPILSTEAVCKSAIDAILKNAEEVFVPKRMQFCVWFNSCLLTRTVGKMAQRFVGYGVDR